MGSKHEYEIGPLGCFLIILFIIVPLILFLTVSTKLKILVTFEDDNKNKIENLEVAVKKVPQVTIKSNERKAEDIKEHLIAHTITNENGTMTFSIVREQQKIRINVLNTKEQFSTEHSLNRDDTKKDMLEWVVTIPNEYLLTPQVEK